MPEPESSNLTLRAATDGATRERLDSRAFERLVQSVVDYAIFMLDEEGKIVSWNPGAERIKGYSAEEIIGEHFSRFYTKEDRDADVPAAALKEAFEKGRFTAEGWRVRKDGSRFWAMVVIDPIVENGKLLGFAKVTRDITEKREAQIELERSREQLFQSQKMEAVGQLTGGLAHDFNNLLTGISGSLELLRTRVAQGRINDLDRFITAALGATSRAATLTQRLLTFARRQSLDPRPIDANKLVSGMEELVRRTFGPGIELEIVLAAGLWATICDSNQLENAILNLCINARDAMPNGGRVTIETANSWLDDGNAARRDMHPGQYVVVCVSDTGTGMAPEVIERAFDPFFTTKSSGEGTGLGLSMVYGFANQSGGQARIYSEVGKGTTVRIYLPRHIGPAAEEAELSEFYPVQQQRRGQTVLVVDDEPAVRMLITETLNDMGITPIEASDARSALKIMSADLPINLVITDVGLPGGMNGREMVDAARSKRPDLKVLFVTGYAENAALNSGHLQPGMQVLSKPFALEKLAARIRAMLDIR